MSYHGLGQQVSFSSTSTTATAAQRPKCLTPEQRKQADFECLTQIKGLGMPPEFYGMDPCAAKMLPDCPRGKISTFLFPVQSTSQDVPADTPVPVDDEAQKRGRLVVGGILAALLVGGGYIAYRVLKKKG